MRRGLANATRLRTAVGKMSQEVINGIELLRNELLTLRRMALVVVLDLEAGKKSYNWMACSRCTDVVLTHLGEAAVSLGKARGMLAQDVEDLEKLIGGKDDRVLG